jgi:anti-anti-sigma regulatory factor
MVDPVLDFDLTSPGTAAFSGALVVDTVSVLRAALDYRPLTIVELDLADVDEYDGEGLTALVAAFKRHTELSVINPPTTVVRVFEHCGLGNLVRDHR